MIYRWSIVWAYFDPIVGSEQGGRRPALVVSGETFNQGMDVVTVLPITRRRPGRTIYPNEALLEPEDSGLESDSVVLAHQIRTITKDRIRGVIGTVTNSRLRAAIHAAIEVHLELHWD